MAAPLQSKAGPKAAGSAAGTAWKPKAAASVAPPPGPDHHMLCIDVGGVLSLKNLDEKLHFKCMMPHAFAFLVLWGRQYGFENLAICSRVNRLPKHGQLHWVQKFLRAIGVAEKSDGGFGVPDENVILCTQTFGPGGKGEAVAHLPITEFIDDTVDCLWSVACDPRGNCHPTLKALFHFDAAGRWRDFSDDWVKPSVSMLKVADWRELGDWFGLDSPAWLWEWLCANGPPNKPVGIDFWQRFHDAEATSTLRSASKYFQQGSSGDYKKWSAALKEVAAAAASSSTSSSGGAGSGSGGKTSSLAAAAAAGARKKSSQAAASAAGDDDSESVIIVGDDQITEVEGGTTESPSERVALDQMTEFTDPGLQPNANNNHSRVSQLPIIDEVVS